MKKTFLIDTNVLLHDPEAIVKFPRHNVVICVTVLEELDRMKRFPNELGKNARRVFHLLDKLGQEGKGSFHEGIVLDNQATLRIEFQNKTKFRDDLSPSISNNRIIMSGLYLKEHGEKVVFVSKDLAARIKAEAIGIPTRDYENLKYAYETLYRGLRHVDVEKSLVDQFLKDGEVEAPADAWCPNEYCVMHSAENSFGVGKYDFERKKIVALPEVPDAWGVKARNLEQRCAIDALLRDDIKLVTLMGRAGTGKTLLALACGLRKVFDEGKYVRILVSRPVVPLGRDIGYLPGTKEEKLFHWMQPIYDNLEFLCESGQAGGSKETMRWLMDSSKMEMEAVTYIRGRSLPKAFIIIDEAQNLTPHEMKTIISRAGEGAKVVLTGDCTQIDNPYLDKNSNGLTYTVGRFNEQSIYGHVFLETTERSELAALAAEIL